MATESAEQARAIRPTVLSYFPQVGPELPSKSKQEIARIPIEHQSNSPALSELKRLNHTWHTVLSTFDPSTKPTEFKAIAAQIYFCLNDMATEFQQLRCRQDALMGLYLNQCIQPLHMRGDYGDGFESVDSISTNFPIMLTALDLDAGDFWAGRWPLEDVHNLIDAKHKEGAITDCLAAQFHNLVAGCVEILPDGI